MDYDRYDAFLHHIFKQTQGDAWFRPSEDNLSAGVALRVDHGEYDFPNAPRDFFIFWIGICLSPFACFFFLLYYWSVQTMRAICLAMLSHAWRILSVFTFSSGPIHRTPYPNNTLIPPPLLSHLPTSQHPTLRSRLITAPGCSDDSMMHMPTNRELQLRTDPATQRRSQKLPNERGRGNPRADISRRYHYHYQYHNNSFAFLYFFSALVS